MPPRKTTTGKKITGTAITKTIKQSTAAASCLECDTTITENTKALQCDGCGGNYAWKCAECLGISSELYDDIVSGEVSCLYWFCDKCRQAVKSPGKMPAKANEKFDEILELLARIDRKTEDIENKLKTKADLSQVEALEERMEKMEERLESLTKSTHTEQKYTEQTQPQQTDELRISTFSQTEEIQDIERRKNLIFYRVPESTKGETTDRNADDKEAIQLFCTEALGVKIESEDITKMYRIGKKDDGKDRPLLVALSTMDRKMNVLQNMKKMKTAAAKYNGISVAHDLTPKQRQAVKKVLEEAKQIDENNGSQENWRYIVVGQTTRPKVLRLPK